MNLQLAGRVALVTGAGSGIGRATALALSAEGVTVVVLDSDARGGRGTVELLAERAGPDRPPGWFVRADVSSEPEMAAAVAEVVRRFGRLDLVVGCAGISGPFGRPVTEVAVAEWDRVMAVNVRGQYLLAKHAIPAMRPGGSVVLVGSDSSFVAAPGMAAYCASKGAVLMLTRALSVDHADDRIRVNCVCPSIVDTPMSRTDLGLTSTGFDATGMQVHTPEAIADLVLFLCSPLSHPVNGAALVADSGGLARSTFPA